MPTLTQRLSLDRLKLDGSPSRDLLAHLHSGDALRQILPKIIRIGIVSWLAFNVILWLFLWPDVYREFERWGLVKAFIGQLIALGAAILVTRITILRAGHLEALPADDFTTLRAFTVLCRWVGEVALIYVFLSGLGALLQPLDASWTALLGKASPAMASRVSSGSSRLLLLAAPLTFIKTAVASGLFLVLYSIAGSIELYLAIEFNTRADRKGGRLP